MNTFLHILKRTIVLFLCVFIGAQVNGAILTLGTTLIPAPAGFDLNTMDGLKAAVPFLEAKHYLFPFLAHAIGTLISALLITRFLTSQQLVFSMMAGILFPFRWRFHGNHVARYADLVRFARFNCCLRPNGLFSL